MNDLSQPAAAGLCPICHQLHTLPYTAAAVMRARLLCQTLTNLALEQTATIPPEFASLSLLPLACSNEGKMVAVVEFSAGKWGYAFSGQIRREYGLQGFADHLADHGALADIALRARRTINPLTDQINTLKKAGRPFSEILPLKLERRHLSSALCSENQALYHVANQHGILRTLPEIWFPPPPYSDSGIPTGVGDCALPKVLQWGNLQGLKPLGAAEFWWGGLNNQNKLWQNGELVPACVEKCQGILGYMLCNFP